MTCARIRRDLPSPGDERHGGERVRERGRRRRRRGEREEVVVGVEGEEEAPAICHRASAHTARKKEREKKNRK